MDERRVLGAAAMLLNDPDALDGVTRLRVCDGVTRLRVCDGVARLRVCDGGGSQERVYGREKGGKRVRAGGGGWGRVWAGVSGPEGCRECPRV